MPTEDEIRTAMKQVEDPELGVNVVDLGLLYGVNVGEDGHVTLDMTLTSMGCPLTEQILGDSRAALEPLERPLLRRGMTTHVRNGAQPVLRLGIEIRIVQERAAVEEAVAHVADRSLDLALRLVRIPAKADTGSDDGGHPRSVATQAG